MKTAIVILNWNGRDFLERFLPGLVMSVRDVEGTQVIVADNGSTDGSLEFLKDQFPDIQTIAFDRNYGFTGGYNKALGQIEAQYYLLLNSDIEVTDGWLEPLVEWMDTHHLCGACAPKLHSWQERDMFEYAGAAGGYIDRYGYPLCRGRVLKMTEKDHGQYDGPADVMWVSGACLMIRDTLFKKLGGLDGRFFAHMEEIDLCWKVQLEGYKVTVVPESVLYHVGGGTLPASSPWKLFLNYRNNLLMLENNLARTYALQLYQDGMEAKDAAELGCRKASRTIFGRLVLDGLSSIVYLCTLRFSYFRSVCRAHRDYRRLAVRPSVHEVKEYVSEKGRIAGVEGIYSRCIVLQAMLHKKDIFRRIRIYFE